MNLKFPKIKNLQEQEIKKLKISVRKINDNDIKTRNLPNQTSGLLITKIEKDSPLNNSIEVNSIILEAQKRIRNVNDLNLAVSKVLKVIKKQFYWLFIIVKIKEDILVLN